MSVTFTPSSPPVAPKRILSFLKTFREEAPLEDERRRILQEGILLDTRLTSEASAPSVDAVVAFSDENPYEEETVETGLALWREGYLPLSLRLLLTKPHRPGLSGDVRLLQLMRDLNYERGRGEELPPALKALHRRLVVTAWETTHLTGSTARPLSLAEAPTEVGDPFVSPWRRLEQSKEDELTSLLGDPSLRDSALVRNGAYEWVSGTALRGRLLASLQEAWEREENILLLRLLLREGCSAFVTLPASASHSPQEGRRRGLLDAVYLDTLLQAIWEATGDEAFLKLLRGVEGRGAPLSLQDALSLLEGSLPAGGHFPSREDGPYL